MYILEYQERLKMNPNIQLRYKKKEINLNIIMYIERYQIVSKICILIIRSNIRSAERCRRINLKSHSYWALSFCFCVCRYGIGSRYRDARHFLIEILQETVALKRKLN